MSSRVDFFFRQRVTESELDLAFDQLEQADHDLASDIGVYGIISGGEPVPHEPVPDLTIDLTGPCRAYDHLGQRIFIGTNQRIDCSLDHSGASTEVVTPGNERWLGVFLKFDRLLSDPRTDGNSQQVYFRRDESFQILVRRGAEAAIGTAERVALVPNELLLCDVKRTAGQTQILSEHIDLSRRQNFIFAQADAVELLTGGWSIIQQSNDTVQQAMDDIDGSLYQHFVGANYRHSAGDLDYTPGGFVQATDVQGALDQIISGVSSQQPGNTGASLVGTEPVTGLPKILSSGNVQGQLAQLLAFLNAHLEDLSAAHTAEAISATPNSEISGNDVQQQLDELLFYVGELVSVHASSTDHDNRYYIKSAADATFYQVGQQVGDADTVDGKQAVDFAAADHQHDIRYLRKFGHYEFGLLSGESETFIANNFPTVVDVKYRRILPGDTLDDDYVVNGTYTADIKVHFREVTAPQGYKYYQAEITNESSQNMRVFINVYTIDSE